MAIFFILFSAINPEIHWNAGKVPFSVRSDTLDFISMAFQYLDNICWPTGKLAETQHSARKHYLPILRPMTHLCHWKKSQLLLFDYQRHCQSWANNKENTKAPHWSFCEVNPPVISGSAHKEPGMRKGFPCQDVSMNHDYVCFLSMAVWFDTAVELRTYPNGPEAGREAGWGSEFVPLKKTWSWKFYPAAQNFTNRMLFRNTHIFKTI